MAKRYRHASRPAGLRWEPGNDLTSVARKALGLASDKYDRDDEAEASIVFGPYAGIRVRLLPSRADALRRRPRRLQAQCAKCCGWFCAGHLFQHTEACRA